MARAGAPSLAGRRWSWVATSRRRWVGAGGVWREDLAGRWGGPNTYIAVRPSAAPSTVVMRLSSQGKDVTQISVEES